MTTDPCAVKGLLPFEQALSLLLSNIEPTTKTINLAIEQSLDYVLTQNIVSPMNIPPHDNSAMDGYAFAQASLQSSQQLKLIGKAFAGQPFQGVCGAGECVRIMTGAKLPAGCDTVEMQENCQVHENDIHFIETKELGQNVRLAGEDIKQGQQVLPRGQRLSSVDIALLASLGIAKVDVYQPIKVALIATGDELKSPGQALTEGDIYESNRYFLAAMLKKLNIEIIDFGVISDDFDAIKQAFIQADQQADVVISSGGVSVGEADYTKAVLASLGEVGFWKLAMKPGKPFAFGKLANSLFFGLPGNPVSALVTMYQLAVPGLIKLQNALPLQRQKFKVKVANKIKKSPGRKDFQRGILTANEHGELTVLSTGAQGSGILSSIAKANCFIVLAQEQGAIAAGELVEVELFDHLIA
ncbi:MAG: molybdopterin molybdotransferase MoeA [Thalassotalea sp.]